MRFRALGSVVLAMALGAATAFGAPKSDRYVVVISLDGLGGYYLDDPNAEMPTLRQLAAEGGRAQSMKASTPTVTWTNHATLVTGVPPAKHGVVGNNYFDRQAKKPVQLISDPLFDKEEIVKVPTVYDVAHDAGLTTMSIRWPAARSAKKMTWEVPEVASDKLLYEHTKPEMIAELKAAGVWSDGEKDKLSSNIQISDETCVREFTYLLKKHRPNLSLLHLIDIDHTEHMYGPKSPEAYAAIKKADGQVKEVWDLIKEEFPGKATLVVVSDHGFSPIERQLFPNVVLREAGLVEVKGPRIVSGQVRMVVQGGAAFIYVMDEANRDAVMQKVRDAFAKVDGVSKIIGPADMKEYGVADAKVDPHAPDMILFAREGCVFGDTAAGALPFKDKPERKGSHGHDRNLPDLHATFLAWGVGIAPNSAVGEISNEDVAPTLAALLGVTMENVDGHAIGVLEK
jgi:predicted AlkP superfamily pyrophosphatase or phosphodiesterase